MPKCKNCNSRIERFHKDRCPVCGVTFPFEGMNSETIEITTNIDVGGVEADYRPCKKKTLFILFALLGVFGVPFFYLKKKKEGIIGLISNAIIIALMSFLLAYFTSISVVVSIVIAFGAMYLLNIIFGLVMIYQPNLKDGNGQFVI